MKKINKLILVSLLLIIMGIGLMITGFLLGGKVYGFSLNQNGFQVYAPSLNQPAAVTYTEEELTLEAFKSIDIDTEFLRVTVVPKKSYGISYKVRSQSDFSYEIKDGTLKVKEQSKNTGGNLINFQWFYIGSTGNSGMEEEYVEIYVPQDAALDSILINDDYCDTFLNDLTAANVSVQSDYGNISISSLTTESLNVDTESADLEIEDTTGDTLTLNNVYGSTELSEVHFNETCDFTSDNGCIELDTVYFHTWKVDAEYGDLDGDTVSCDTASLTLDNGNCHLKDFTVNSVDARSEYGDITLKLTTPISAYGYDLHTEYGEIDVEGYDLEEEKLIVAPTDSTRQITIDCESGIIKISGS